MRRPLVVVYAALAVLGTVLPLSQFAPWVMEHGFDLPLFVTELFSTRIGGFFGWDVVVSAVVLVTFIIVEGRRIGLPAIWLPICASFLVGVSLGLPLFLLMRERRLGEPAGVV